MTRPTLFLGVDPAARRDGFGVCALDMTDRTARFLRFKTPLDFYDWIRSEEAPAKECTVVCIENSHLQNSTFKRHLSGTILEQLARSRNVGMNQEASRTTVQAAQKVYGSRVIEISPEKKGAKWTPATFARIVASDRVTLTDTKKPTQDEIDAYQLASIAANQWAGFLNSRTNG
jgi:predicted transcriptional regulator